MCHRQVIIVSISVICDHGEEAQGEEDVRQGGGGEPHRQAHRDGLQGGAEEEGEEGQSLETHSR